MYVVQKREIETALFPFSSSLLVLRPHFAHPPVPGTITITTTTNITAAKPVVYAPSPRVTGANVREPARAAPRRRPPPPKLYRVRAQGLLVLQVLLRHLPVHGVVRPEEAEGPVHKEGL